MRDDQSPQQRIPLRMVVWTAGAILLSGLCCYVGMVAVPWLAVHRAIGTDYGMESAPEHIAELGGPEKASKLLTIYIRMPTFVSSRKANAIDMLGRCGQYGASPLIRLFDDSAPQVRAQAITTVGLTDPKMEDLVPPLIKRLSDVDPKVRETSMLVLTYFARTHIGTDTAPDLWAPAVPILSAALNDPSDSIREAARLALDSLSKLLPQQAGPGPEPDMK